MSTRHLSSTSEIVQEGTKENPKIKDPGKLRGVTSRVQTCRSKTLSADGYHYPMLRRDLPTHPECKAQVKIRQVMATRGSTLIGSLGNVLCSE
jgi:hypothetical protein